MEKSILLGYQARLFKMRKRLMREVDMIEDEMREDVVAPGDPSAVPSHPADEDIEGFDAQVALRKTKSNCWKTSKPPWNASKREPTATATNAASRFPNSGSTRCRTPRPVSPARLAEK